MLAVRADVSAHPSDAKSVASPATAIEHPAVAALAAGLGQKAFVSLT